MGGVVYILYTLEYGFRIREFWGSFTPHQYPNKNYVQLEPNKEYAVKVEEGKKVVDEIQRKEK